MDTTPAGKPKQRLARDQIVLAGVCSPRIKILFIYLSEGPYLHPSFEV
jgi:hypothetical protein